MKTQEGRRLAGGRGHGGTRLRTEIHDRIVPRSMADEPDTAVAGALPSTVPSQGTTKLLYSVAEAAQLLSLSRAHLYRLLGRGELASVWSGRSRRISRAALEAYIDHLEKGGVR